MQKNLKVPSLIALAVIIALLAFFGGMAIGKSKKSFFAGPEGMRQFANQQGQRPGQNGQGIRRNGQNVQFVNGEIISQDEKSLTVKVQNGGSKIIFLSASTTVSKMADANLSDLTAGVKVSANGALNADGSLNATAIQIRNDAFPPVPVK